MLPAVILTVNRIVSHSKPDIFYLNYKWRWFSAHFFVAWPPIFEVKVLDKAPHRWGSSFGWEKSGFPVQPEEKIWKQWGFLSIWRQCRSSNFFYLPKRLSRSLRSMDEPFKKGTLGLFWINFFAFSVLPAMLSHFLQDVERNDGSAEKPYYMTKDLQRIVGKRNRTPKHTPRDIPLVEK